MVRLAKKEMALALLAYSNITMVLKAMRDMTIFCNSKTEKAMIQ